MGAKVYTSKYIDNEIMSLARERLVPLLYEHLLIHLRQLQVQIRHRDFEGKAVTLGKASATIGELATTIDRDVGGDGAQGLDALYAYLSTEMLDVDRTMDPERLARLIEMVASLHESWVIVARTRWPRNAITETYL